MIYRTPSDNIGNQYLKVMTAAL